MSPTIAIIPFEQGAEEGFLIDPSFPVPPQCESNIYRIHTVRELQVEHNRVTLTYARGFEAIETLAMIIARIAFEAGVEVASIDVEEPSSSFPGPHLDRLVELSRMLHIELCLNAALEQARIGLREIDERIASSDDRLAHTKNMIQLWRTRAEVPHMTELCSPHLETAQRERRKILSDRRYDPRRREKLAVELAKLESVRRQLDKSMRRRKIREEIRAKA